MKNKHTDLAAGFAEACREYAAGAGESFDRDALRKAAEVINSLCDKLASAKEKEEGKERTSPHTPYREKGKKEKKAATTTARVRVREEFLPPSRKTATTFATGKNIPELFVDYWFHCMETNYEPAWYDAVSQRYITAWRRNLLAFWNNAGHDRAWLRYKAAREASAACERPRAYSPDEWVLCAERCRHFDAKLGRCRSGCAIPPEYRSSPLAPEECVRFHGKERV